MLPCRASGLLTMPEPSYTILSRTEEAYGLTSSHSPLDQLFQDAFVHQILLLGLIARLWEQHTDWTRALSLTSQLDSFASMLVYFLACKTL
jgi:hypothetical protein